MGFLSFVADNKINFAQTCGYKKCRPYQLDDETWLYSAPIVFSCAAEDTEQYILTLSKILWEHGQKMGHKRMKVVDV